MDFIELSHKYQMYSLKAYQKLLKSTILKMQYQDCTSSKDTYRTGDMSKS